MNSTDEVKQNSAWWSGANEGADDALALALDSLRAEDFVQCFMHLREAMILYGWKYHSDRKARRLWSKWDRLSEDLREHAPRRDTQAEQAVESLYHEVYRAVHFDGNRRQRRNTPPRDPAARIHSVVPVGGM